MKLVRRIPVNNGGFRCIYSDNRGNYHCKLEHPYAQERYDKQFDFVISKSKLKKLYDAYYSRNISPDFLRDYTIYENPIINAPECDVIMLLNWYSLVLRDYV